MTRFAQLAAIALDNARLYEDAQHELAERKRTEAQLRYQKALLESLSEASPDGILAVSPERQWLFFNRRFNELWQLPESILHAHSVAVGRETLLDKLVDPLTAMQQLAELDSQPDLSRRAEVALKDRRTFDIYTAPVKGADQQHYGRVWFYRDITERKRAEAERERLITELQDALANIKTLRGLIPICASCKKIRDDRGYWNQLESYIAQHTEADFSHGICPDCIRKLYPEFADEPDESLIDAPRI
jgi:PAS domain-containing protein